MKKIIGGIVIALLAFICVVLVWAVVPVAIWGLLVLMGLQAPLWKVLVGYLLLSIILDWICK